MPTPDLRPAALLLGLLGSPGPPPETPAAAEVVAAALAHYLEPDRNALSPERLGKGERVRVVDADPATGWLTIEPPPSAFAWVERSALRVEAPGVGRVEVPRTATRAGVAGARLPGPPGVELCRGATVPLLDRAPLTVGAGDAATTWMAIAPPPGDVRYVRAEGVAWSDPEPPPAPPAEARTAFVEGPAPAPVDGGAPAAPPEVAAEVATIEAEHRAELAQPVESWRLDRVRRRYEDLLKRASDPAATAAIRGRLDLVTRQEEAARAARTFQTVLDRSRRRDRAVAMTRRKLAEVERPRRRRPFVAEGLVQPSSRLVDGRRVFALIGPQGNPVAYLDVPPGLDARRVTARRVGVHGSVHYNEALGARLIAVRDIEPLE